MQERYWKRLNQYKFTLYYLDEHFSNCVKIERTISTVLAIMSSSAIAAWAIWQKHAFVWAFLIGLSQILTVINSFLPYKKRVNEISEMKVTLTPIYNEMESKWFSVSNGTLSEDGINCLLHSYTKLWLEADSKFFVLDVLPNNDMFTERANNKKDSYFEQIF